MPSWRQYKDRGQSVATTTANREVAAEIEVEVTAATTLEFQVAVARLAGSRYSRVVDNHVERQAT